MKKLNMEQQKLVEDNLNLVYFIVEKYFYMNYGYIEKDELVAEGFLCLCRCAKFYDKDKGVKFSYYACKCIKKHLVRVLQDYFKRTFETYDIVDYQEEFSIEDKYNFIDIEEELREFLSQHLNKKQIEVLICYYFKNMNTEEIAKKVGYKDKYSVNTIRIKALKKLQKIENLKNEYIQYFL